MTEPYDYQEVSNWFLNDEGLHGLALRCNSGTELYELCNDFGILEVGQSVDLTRENVAYSWRCVHNVEQANKYKELRQ